MLLAQLSDLHLRQPGQRLRDNVDPWVQLDHAIGSLLALDRVPDAVLLSGDVADDGQIEAYDALAQRLAWVNLPLIIVPGNHDARLAMVKGLGQLADLRPDNGFLHSAHQIGPVRVLALDTLSPGEIDGRLCPTRLDWLEQQLDLAPHAPTLLALHHPPMAFGAHRLGRSLLEGFERLRAMLDRRTAETLMVCGHLHRTIFARFGQVPCLVGPSICFGFSLNLAETKPARSQDLPGYLLHVWDAEDGFVSHLVQINPLRSLA